MTENDFVLESHGSLCLLQPLSGAANEWVSECIPDDAIRYGGAVVVEPRYVADIVAGVESDGLSVAPAEAAPTAGGKEMSHEDCP